MLRAGFINSENYDGWWNGTRVQKYDCLELVDLAEICGKFSFQPKLDFDIFQQGIAS